MLCVCHTATYACVITGCLLQHLKLLTLFVTSPKVSKGSQSCLSTCLLVSIHVCMHVCAYPCLSLFVGLLPLCVFPELSVTSFRQYDFVLPPSYCKCAYVPGPLFWLIMMCWSTREVLKEPNQSAVVFKSNSTPAMMAPLALNLHHGTYCSARCLGLGGRSMTTREPCVITSTDPKVLLEMTCEGYCPMSQ